MSMRRVFDRVLLSLALSCAGCAGPHTAADGTPGPRLRVLGTVQDGGLPHAACTCRHCERARRDPEFRRYVAGLALIVPAESGREAVYLIDATPDIREQLDMLRDVRDPPAGQVDRKPVDGVLLTHAHIGHYLGLAFFGFEAVHTKDLPVWCTERMADFLRNNGPWSQLVRIGNIRLHTPPAGQTIDLPMAGQTRVTVTPIRVPHRDEYSDTVGFVIRCERANRLSQETETLSPALSLRGRGRYEIAAGSAATGAAAGTCVMYVPDTEPWRAWQPSLLEVLEREGVDVLLVDGTFYSADELPGRPVSSIGHPLMTDSMDLLEPLVRAGRLKVCFTHLNHSNPALDASSGAAREVRRRGFVIAKEGQEIGLL